MKETNILSIKKFKDYKKTEILENEYLPTLNQFVSLVEDNIFKGDFSEKMFDIRTFCLINFLRVIFCEAEYCISINKIDKNFLEEEYKKISDNCNNLKSDIQKIMNMK